MTTTLILSLVTLLFNCSTKCTTDNIDITGTWDVYNVEMIDPENKMREFFESTGEDYDNYLDKIKLFEQVGFTFKDNDTLFVENPKQLGGNGETPYIYENGSDTLNFGGRDYGFEVVNCNEIKISDLTPFESAKLVMYCKRK